MMDTGLDAERGLREFPHCIGGADDFISMPLQCSTQWDGLGTSDLMVRLEAMNAQGVDRQWVSASPTHFYPWAVEELAVWVATEANRLVAEHVRSHLTG